MLQFKFDEKKTTELARFFIQKSARLKIASLKLLKLMYLADRESLDKWGIPITGDSYVSMRLGPVLSKTYSLIKGYGDEKTINERTPDFQKVDTSPWYQQIEKSGKYRLKISQDTAGTSFRCLSDDQLAIAENIQQKFGKYDQWELIDKVHEMCDEWDDPREHGSAVMDIDVIDIFRALNKTEEEIVTLYFKSQLQS